MQALAVCLEALLCSFCLEARSAARRILLRSRTASRLSWGWGNREACGHWLCSAAGLMSRIRVVSLLVVLGATLSACATGVSAPEQGDASVDTPGTNGGSAGHGGASFNVGGTATGGAHTGSAGALANGGAAGHGAAVGGASGGTPSGGNLGGVTSAGGVSAGSANAGAGNGGSASGGVAAVGCFSQMFEYAPQGKSLSSVHVSGSFNSWAEPGTALAYDAAKDLWQVAIELDAGSYEYKFVLDGSTWISDPHNPETANDNFGGVNSVLTVVCQ